jgi:hypothetical protein
MTVISLPPRHRQTSFIILQSKELLGFHDDWRPRFWLENWDGIADSETTVVWVGNIYEAARAEALAIVADGCVLIDTVERAGGAA